MSVHPNKVRLRQFVERKLSEDEYASVEAHVEECELCREYCENYRSLDKSIEWAWSTQIPQSAWDFAKRIQKAPRFRSVINLKPLIESFGDLFSAVEHVGALALAADGSTKPKFPVPRCLATYYSEDPDLVLRVMTHPDQEGEHLQLVSEDPNLRSCVVLQLPDLGHEFLTDHDGCVNLAPGLIKEYGELKWRVKLPDAEFDLTPLIHDPNATKYSSETTLETKKKDKIRVRFEGKAEGKLVIIEVLELEGESKLGTLRMVISKGTTSSV
jgi:hypothetical protein